MRNTKTCRSTIYRSTLMIVATILPKSRLIKWFNIEKIDAMQKDPRAKGLDLNVLKVEVPEDELED